MSKQGAREGYGPGVTQFLGSNVAFRVVTVPYSATPTFDASEGRHFEITPTDGVAFVVQIPLNPRLGLEIVIRIINTTGGALGALTFQAGGDGSYEVAPAALTQPANGGNRSYRFQCANNPAGALRWFELGARATDVSN